MTVQTVTATINGQTYTLTLNGSTGKYEATVTAPTKTSFNESGGYFAVTVTATDTAGNSTTQDATNTANRLVVKEKVPPVISALSPAANARMTTAAPTITGTIKDETNGSGINLSSFSLKIDGTAVSNANITFTPVTGGYNFSYTASGLAQGNHTYTVNVSDNDGNAATQQSVTFVVDTVAPTLNVTAPVNALVINQTNLTVTGTTSDATSNPTTVTIAVNGADQGAVTVSSGAFSKAVTLTAGTNTIVVKARDSAGLETTVTRTVTLDTVAPTISGLTITPNPVDTGATFIISVSVTD
ncbi:Ig-like domain-containing protein [Domibacillus indicus]|uniref:Ig-like domain-containing protein n=1 Tax=Domibacillus indicus TaxID=1437523 RepID=UPI00203B5968|nr:Ig-like domain-containing protein [Domibacillus indicus]MCM3789413.1 Ig-like domain-containing protein [Domibacillus indicus]